VVASADALREGKPADGPALQAQVLGAFVLLIAAAAVAGAGVLTWRTHRREQRGDSVPTEDELDAAVAKVRRWLAEGRAHARG
jgi:hypothetical protein